MTGAFNPSTGLILSIAHVALAVSVTVHVLTRNRSSGAAVAWIGLAWLSPVVGSLLYALLGINRVQRRARCWQIASPDSGAPESSPGDERDDHLAPLERAARYISHRPVLGGNDVRMLRSGDEAYPLMLEAIEAATRSIALTSYIFRTDSAGRAFIDALSRAHARGVAVRVLIDGYGGGYLSSGAYRRLRHAGVPAARFMHSALPWRMPFLNLRSHRKLLALDGAVAFTGGLNIGAENLVKTGPRHPVLDTHFRCAGPAVAQLCEAFAEQWRFATGETLHGSEWFPAVPQCGGADVRVITSGPNQDIEKIELLVLEAVSCARSSIQIMTPYFLPDDRIITALALAAMRGVGVDIVLPEHSNHPTVDWAMRAHVGPLLSAGCRMWTHRPPFDHSKLMAIDGIWGFIGSANWDMRSFRLNFEINLEVYHSDVVAQIGHVIASNCSASLTAQALRQRTLPAQLRDGAFRLMLPYL